jgi:hypothetical protein
MLHDLTGIIADTSIYEHVLYPEVDGWNTILLRGAHNSAYYAMRIDETPVESSSDSSPDAGTGQAVSTVSIADFRVCKFYDPSVRLVPCPAQGYFLTTFPVDESQLSLSANERDYRSWTLHAARWKDLESSPRPELEFWPIGPDNFDIPSFAVNPNGSFLFWPQAREEDVDRVWDEYGNEDVKVRPASYHIMACRLRGDRFSDPFIVGDLPDDTDTLAILSTPRAAALEMLRTEFSFTQDEGGNPLYVDNEGKPVYNAANIWYTSIPDVRCATATGCESTNPLVNPGGKATFHVEVRNDGNVYLSGCSLTLCGYNESTDTYERVEDSTTAIVFGENTLQESNWNPMGDDGHLRNVEDDYALAPGKISVYAVTVAIPDDWSGEKKVLFVAHDGIEALDMTLTAQASRESVANVEFHVEPGEYRVVRTRTAPDNVRSPLQRHMETLILGPTVAENTFSPAPMSVTDTGGQRGTYPGVKPILPDTSDSSTSGGLEMGLAAAGAAILAYERRRAHNERLEGAAYDEQ